MICETVRKGMACPFMTAKGCGYRSGICGELVDQCQGCSRSVQYESGWYCSASPDPTAKWKAGHCNLASHVTLQETRSRNKINPLKSSKRGEK